MATATEHAPPSDLLEHCLTDGELQDFLKVTALTLHRYRTKYGLPFYRMGPDTTGTIRYDRREVEAWLRTRHCTPIGTRKKPTRRPKPPADGPRGGKGTR